MAIWEVTDLRVVSDLESHSDVVTQVSWVRRGKTELHGKTNLPEPGKTFVVVTPGAEVPFVGYSSLTEDDVLGWVWQQVNKSAAEVEPYVAATFEGNTAAIYQNADLTAAGESRPLPWSN